MSKTVKKKNIKVTKKVHVSPFNIYWEKTNYLFLILGFIFIIAGFYTMTIGSWDSTASLVLSPILLVIGYIIIFPASILYRKKRTAEPTETTK